MGRAKRGEGSRHAVNASRYAGLKDGSIAAPRSACKVCGGTERYTSGACKVCQRAKRLERYYATEADILRAERERRRGE